ncbi:glycosyltransferase family 2 protein [Photobacterium carnosum]|uniref:glycosyltransferase family 2 protein n=1 Tax=Photobacterium carnosum TaxID=2023717 RepID=UPI001E4642C0|nr:glycosyltransferase family 2 protein [Photobacterium carnosum]MCD9529095.1 glycosyltransferase [Photobacterium carnosum]
MAEFKKGLVSVILPFYNCEEFMYRALSGLLNQSYKNIQIIILNDGSTDKTEEYFFKEYIDKFKSENFLVDYHYHTNVGLAKTFNIGLKHVKGEYLTWIDPDDFLDINAIKYKVDFLNKNKSYSFVRNNAKVVNENNIDKIVHVLKSNKNEFIFEDLLLERKMPLCAGNYLLRTDVFFKCLHNRNIIDKYRSQNWPSLLPIAYKNKCGYIDEVLNTIVIRNSSMSADSSYNEVMFRLSEHEVLLNDVLDYIGAYEYKNEVNKKYTSTKLIQAVKFNNKSDIIKYSKKGNNIKAKLSLLLYRLGISNLIWCKKNV